MNESTVSEYERHVIEIVHDLTQDWDKVFDAEVNSSTAIAADLGFDSLDVVHMVTAITQRYDKSDFPFEKLLMVDGQYVEDLTINQIASFIQHHQ